MIHYEAAAVLPLKRTQTNQPETPRELVDGEAPELVHVPGASPRRASAGVLHWSLESWTS